MTVSNEKICKVPRSGKEVYSKKSILCGEHKRSIKENSKKAFRNTVILVTAIGIAAVNIKNILKN